MAGSRKRRVLLVSSQPLFGEAIEGILRLEREIELSGPLIWKKGKDPAWPAEQPDIVLLATRGSGRQEEAGLAEQVMARYPDAPLIQLTLDKDSMRLITSRELLASSEDLIEAIRSAPGK